MPTYSFLTFGDLFWCSFILCVCLCSYSAASDRHVFSFPVSILTCQYHFLTLSNINATPSVLFRPSSCYAVHHHRSLCYSLFHRDHLFRGIVGIQKEPAVTEVTFFVLYDFSLFSCLFFHYSNLFMQLGNHFVLSLHRNNPYFI